jgi:hypothetical protein
MMKLSDIIFWGYLVGVFFMWAYVYAEALETGGDQTAAAILGLPVAFLWPLIITVELMRYMFFSS